MGEKSIFDIMENIEQEKKEKNPSEKAAKEMKVSRETIFEIDSARETENLKKIEAAFFIAGRWLSMQDLITLTDLNPILLRQLIEKLKESYGEDSGIQIIEKDNAWKMDVKPDYVNMINKLATGSSEFTKAEQETLAVIAYKQPVKQSVIVKIRGNKAYEHVKNFISLGLVKAKRAGHTLELELSEEFHDYFHIGQENIADNKPQ
ncbi:SMC-Scp complex subunit ScpB [Candidatus Pacearchaeota archaeon]|nr:SMC-Scp complex subunit ScpB [Candidatus Pacearchaeota archaeon]